MTRTPLQNRSLTDGKDKTPLGGRALSGKDKTPLGNKTVKERSGPDSRIVDASLDQRLLDVLRSLNLAVAAVAQARDQRFADPQATLSPQIAVQAMLHLKDAAQQLDQLRRTLAQP